MKKILPILFVLLVGLAGCNTKTNVVRSGTDDGRSDSGGIDWGGGPGGGGDDGDDGGGSTSPGQVVIGKECTEEGTPRNDYATYAYEVFPVKAHGNMYKSGRTRPSCADGNTFCVWSSSDLPSPLQSVFVTDSVLKFRIMTTSGPSRGAKDSRGNTCMFEPAPYKLLTYTVGVRKKGENYYRKQKRFQNVPLNGCSEVINFGGHVVPNSPSEPFIVDVFDVEWDHSCNSSKGNYGCPMHTIWENDCIGFELQMETDQTVAIPQ